MPKQQQEEAVVLLSSDDEENEQEGEQHDEVTSSGFPLVTQIYILNALHIALRQREAPIAALHFHNIRCPVAVVVKVPLEVTGPTCSLAESAILMSF